MRNHSTPFLLPTALTVALSAGPLLLSTGCGGEGPPSDELQRSAASSQVDWSTYFNGSDGKPVTWDGKGCAAGQTLHGVVRADRGLQILTQPTHDALPGLVDLDALVTSAKIPDGRTIRILAYQYQPFYFTGWFAPGSYTWVKVKAVAEHVYWGPEPQTGWVKAYWVREAHCQNGSTTPATPTTPPVPPPTTPGTPPATTPPASNPPSTTAPASWTVQQTGVSFTSLPAALLDGSGRLNLLYRNTSGSLAHLLRDYNGLWHAASPSVWGGTLQGPPAAALAGGVLHAVVRGSDDSLYYRSSSSGWTLLAQDAADLRLAHTTSAPAVVVDGRGNLRVYARLIRRAVQGVSTTVAEGTIVENIRFAGSGSWRGWRPLGSVTSTKAPAVARDGQGALHLFIVGPGGSLLQQVLLPDAWGNYGPWSGSWLPLGYGAAPAVASDPVAVTVESSVRLYLFGSFGNNGALYELLLGSGSWNAISPPTGTMVDGPSVAAVGGTSHATLLLRDNMGRVQLLQR